MLKIYFFIYEEGSYFYAMNPEMLIRETSTIQWVELGLFFGAFLVQSFYYLGVYLKLALYKPPPARKKKNEVSVVICARNEADNLERFLPKILTQDYPAYEVGVVNDRSTDRTEEVLTRLSQQYSHLRFTNIPASETTRSGKKLALTIGLRAARYDRVLLTDADCYPESELWIREMTSPLGREKKIVLGYGRYARRKGLLNVLIRYDTLFSAMQYISFALKGKPYMGIGRNLAYDKNLFFRGKGFSRHYHILSGDDDLFVNEHASRSNTAVEFRPDSQTVSVPEMKWRNWIRQKQRHLTAGSLYRKSSRLRLGIEYLSRILLYIFFILTCINANLWIWVLLGIFFLFQVIRMTVLKLTMSRLKESYLLLPSLLFDPFMPLILGLIWFSNIFVTKYQPWS
jgi:biofilm PGA synthesis N-glycosyltransferase PgaC